MKVKIPVSDIYNTVKRKSASIVRDSGLAAEGVVVRAAPLSTKEAIGNPEDKDYPLLVGVERMMQAEFKGSLGQAFTDRYGNFNGRLIDIIEMDLTNNFRRAVFISSLNAVMRYLGLINRSVHCKDEEPRECSRELVKYIEKRCGHPKIAFVGFQPRMVEALASHFELRVTDMDRNNIGTEKFGIAIHGPEKTAENLDWCDIALVTGTTIVNNTIGQFMISKPVVFYGVSISGVAKLLDLEHFCAYGH